MHVGAADMTGRIVTLEASEIPPGGEGLVQIQLDRPVGMVHGDHLILRDQSAQRTIGGGVVFDPMPVTRGRPRAVRLEFLRAQEQPTAGAALGAAFAHVDTIDLAQFEQSWNLNADEAAALVRDVDMRIVDDGRRRTGLTRARWDTLESLVLDGLRRWHDAHPDRDGGERERAAPGAR